MTKKEEFKEIIIENQMVDLDKSDLKAIDKFLSNCVVKSNYTRYGFYGYDSLFLNCNAFTYGFMGTVNCDVLNENVKYGLNINYPYGMYGGSIEIYPDLISIYDIYFINECLDTLKDYPLLDDERYYKYESELQEEEIKDFLQYHPQYKELKEKVANWFYDNSCIECEYLDYSESALLEYLNGLTA